MEVLDGEGTPSGDGSSGGPTFHVRTDHTSWVIAVTRFGHLEQIHYGDRVSGLGEHGTLPLRHRATHPPGMAVAYDESRDPAYCLDGLALAWSGLGKGDFREPALEIRMPDGSFVTDLTYRSHRVSAGTVPCLDGLPGALDPDGRASSLIITLADEVGGLECDLVVTTHPGVDVITRRTVLRVVGTEGVSVRRLMSQLTDLPDLGFDLITFDGAWIAEGHRHRRPLAPGLYVNNSLTGDSSNRHNPGVLLAERHASEAHGAVYGFNLVYSGSHFTGVEQTAHGLVRVLSGINPTGFEWRLEPGERFETPEAVMTFSRNGFGGVSDQFHSFVARHVVRGEWADRERPVKLNTWESMFFDVDERTLRSMARSAARLGCELFVVDDGWFGTGSSARTDDRRGLGDWVVDPATFPDGLRPLAEHVTGLGMMFGLWFEPEMVNPDSDLFRAHPDWVIRVPGREPSRGRHQLVLDLGRDDVRDHLVERIGAVLDSAPIGYVKWDMNRHLSDVGSSRFAAGEVAHRRVLGLYDLLRRIFEPRPHILLETCSSGGNRFDLGMLCFGPQIWTSDNTDPIERIDIQLGLSHLYPQSTMGAHVSAAPHFQTLRQTPLSTRFNVAALGILGYELDPRDLDPAERREVARQIRFYKEHRRTLQFGRFLRHDPGARPEQHDVTIVAPDQRHAVHAHLQTRVHAAQPGDRIPLRGLDPELTYRVRTRAQTLDIRAFGHLLGYLLPKRIKPTGMLVRTAAKVYRRPDAGDDYTATGATLLAGTSIEDQFVGQEPTARTRLHGDHGSTLTTITAVDTEPAA
ncbi:MAG TPA: alpha-galactosidase [Intrasporangiaceae bacterium]|nr:alpha-galactosidase [Intrasporangiaceae bacterium]